MVKIIWWIHFWRPGKCKCQWGWYHEGTHLLPVAPQAGDSSPSWRKMKRNKAWSLSMALSVTDTLDSPELVCQDTVHKTVLTCAARGNPNLPRASSSTVGEDIELCSHNGMWHNSDSKRTSVSTSHTGEMLSERSQWQINTYCGVSFPSSKTGKTQLNYLYIHLWAIKLKISKRVTTVDITPLLTQGKERTGVQVGMAGACRCWPKTSSWLWWCFYVFS